METLIVIIMFLILLLTNEMWFIVWYKSYGKDDMVSFGNYLLSTDRDGCTSDQCKKCVTHADIENWKIINAG